MPRVDQQAEGGGQGGSARGDRQANRRPPGMDLRRVGVNMCRHHTLQKNIPPHPS